MQRHEIEAWLGPALEEMTEEQVDRFASQANRIGRRHPDPDEQDLRDAAMSAAVQYLLGETTTTDAGRALVQARIDLARAMAVSKQLAAMAYEDGLFEHDAAEAAGIDRMTLRKVLGKR